MRPAWKGSPIITRTTSPGEAAISADTIKSHLRITGADQDSTIDLIAAAVAENLDGYSGYLQRALIEQSWTIGVEGPNRGGAIFLPLTPAASITAINYFDTSGEEQTAEVTDFRLTKSEDWAFVTPKPGKSWPQTEARPDAINIEYVCGYGAAEEDIPAPIRLAACLLAGHFYENRESTTSLELRELPMGVRAILEPYKLGYAG